MNIHYREYGEGSPLLILHGLLGSSDNWASLARIYGENFHVYTIDQRNHGQSFHDDDFSYDALTSDLVRFISEQGLKNVSLIGHSMGGKVVMKYALENPSNVAKLIVADMSPKSYKVDYDLVFRAINAVDIAAISSRSEAEAAVKQHIDDFAMRQFLLKNLTRDGQGYKWKANVSVVEENILKMGDWSTTGQQFDNPTLFIHGSQSGYVKETDHGNIATLFPQVQHVELEAGHWLHAEKPNEFMEATAKFLLS